MLAQINRPMSPKSKKSALQVAKELPDDTQLEEGDYWFAVATSWWEEFQACPKAKDAPSVKNHPLIDKQLSSKAHKVAVLKPKLEEGLDFVFIPESSWDVIARELDFDWEIRRQVVYQRSHQQLQIEPYPFAFKIFTWTTDESEPTELVDGADREVVVLGSQTHTLGQLFSEVWLTASDTFRRKYPQFLGGINPTASTSPELRLCYHAVRASTDTMEWKPIENMLKRPRAATLLRTKKRQARDNESCDEQQSEDEDERDAELYEQLKGESTGLMKTMHVKLGDLRLDERSKVSSGTARLHELLIEQKAPGRGDVGWLSQGHELQWRMALVKGDVLDALDTTRTWFEARLLAVKRDKVHVHYRSWEAKWDEWIPRTSPRLSPPYSRVPKWRSALALRPHSLVQIGLQVPRLKHVKWRNATVIEVVSSTNNEQTRGDGDGIGLKVHVQVDDDDIWVWAHDDLLCRSNTHSQSNPLTKRERGLLHDTLLATEDGGEDDTNNLVNCSSRMNLRARVGPARNLNRSFSKVQDRPSSAGRTPGPRRGRSRSRSQVFSDNTSPEPVSPALRPNASRSELQTLWTRVGNNLQVLQSSWTQLGEGLFAAMEETKNATNQGKL